MRHPATIGKVNKCSTADHSVIHTRRLEGFAYGSRYTLHNLMFLFFENYPWLYAVVKVTARLPIFFSS